MAQVLEVRKGATDPRAKLAARVAKDFAKADKGRKAALELTQVPVDLGPHAWQIFAFGPYQTPDAQPGRIIKKGEKAYIAIVVWMNAAMCQVITQHGDKIELNIFTSDMQRMVPVVEDDMSHYCCIETVSNHCWYVYVWEFTPPREACIYETNICARLCNCSDVPLPDYAGFVRQVFDFDPESLWPSPPAEVLPDDFPLDDWPRRPRRRRRWGFDRPIRYMVYNPESSCDCDNYPCPDVYSGPAED
jgi:hypothetical protein